MYEPTEIQMDDETRARRLAATAEFKARLDRNMALLGNKQNREIAKRRLADKGERA